MHAHAALVIAPAPDTLLLPESSRHPGPDVHHEFVDVMTIDTVRQLKHMAYQAPVRGETRWLVVHALEYTHAAQNALLKLLEEPPARTKIVIVASHIQKLLPTVRSRLEIITAFSEDSDTSVSDEVHEWLCMSISERMERISHLHKQPDSKRHMAQLLSEVIAQVTRARLPLSLEKKSLVADVSQWLSDTGSSKKYLLEALALALPIATKG